MGFWGTAISSNDTYEDIYDEFFKLYNDGENVENISSKLIIDNQETILDAEDSNNFWFALAKAQWECKQLDKELLDRIHGIIETGADLDVWRQRGASEQDIKKRKTTLDKFLVTLKTERPKAKSRKKKVIRQPAFNKGDCITFTFPDGNYGGAVVLEAIRDTEYGWNLIATTRINQTAKPTKNDFIQAEVLILNFAKWKDGLCINWMMSDKFSTITHLFEVVEHVEVEIDYNTVANEYGFSANIVGNLIEIPYDQFQSEKTKSGPVQKRFIKEWLKKKRWYSIG